MSVSGFEGVYSALRAIPWAAEVQIENKAGVFQLLPTCSSQVAALVEIAKKSLFGVFHNFGYKEAHPGTLNFLYALFGERRLNHLCRRSGVDLTKGVTRLEIQKIFVSAAEVHYIDLEELLYQSKKEPSQLPVSTNMKELQLLLAEIDSIEECEPSILQRMVEVLIPFHKREDLFLDDEPITITLLDSGKTFRGVKERVAVYESLRDPSVTKKSWIMQLAKQLTNLEVPKGAIIANSKGGFHVVHEVVHKAGAYKYFLKPLGKEPRDPTCYVLYRGTRDPILATDGHATLIDDLRPDIGSAGAIATYDETHELMTDVRKKFICSKEVRIVGIAMSLGGAHLSRDAILHPFNKIITVASPGIDKATCELFAKKVSKMSITHYIEDGDLVHHFGEAKLGYRCNPADVRVKVHALIPGEREKVETDGAAHFATKLPEAYTPFFFNAVAGFTYALVHVHNRMTLQGPHRILTYTNQKDKKEVDRILSHQFFDRRLESIRRTISQLFGRERFYEFALSKSAS